MKQLALFLVLCVTAAYAVMPDTAKLIQEGDDLLATDKNLAERRFIEAKRVGANLQDWDGMLFLADRFQKLGKEPEMKDCYLLALQYAQDLARHANSQKNPAQSCAEAISALSDVAASFAFLNLMPMAPDTQSQMQAMSTQAASQSDHYRQKGCP